jgi:hypothetical protein
MLELVCPYAPGVFGDLREELGAEYPSFFNNDGDQPGRDGAAE